MKVMVMERKISFGEVEVILNEVFDSVEQFIAEHSHIIFEVKMKGWNVAIPLPVLETEDVYHPYQLSLEVVLNKHDKESTRVLANVLAYQCTSFTL